MNMRKISYRPYALLIFFLLCIISYPKNSAESLRAVAICALSPCWNGVNAFKEKMFYFLQVPYMHIEKESIENQTRFDFLDQENQLLKNQINQVREWILNEARIDEQLEKMQSFKTAPAFLDKNFFLRRSQELSRILELQLQSMPAQIIFREPSSWSSSIWINVGSKNNAILGQRVIDKNSPVLVGASIIGVIEYVGHAQSRVRLITDSSSHYSVRAIRGGEQEGYLIEHIEALLLILEARKEELLSEISMLDVLSVLNKIKEDACRRFGNNYLAKGELYGSGAPLWRAKDQVLKGIGFNYDFADEEGLARDLRTGRESSMQSKKRLIEILKEGDLLVTTGLDGVLPAGLRVAIVSRVNPLKEGASSYEIEAVSTAGNLDELRQVIVLPPIGE